MLYFDPNAESCRVLNRTLCRRLNNTEDPFNYRQYKHTKHKSYGSQTRTSVESITEAQGRGGFTVTETKGKAVFLNNWNYRPQTKLRKGNVFTSVCQEFCPQVGGGVHPPGRHPYADGYCSGRYAFKFAFSRCVSVSHAFISPVCQCERASTVFNE